MNCMNCGNPLEAGEKFCTKCGQRVEEGATVGNSTTYNEQTTTSVEMYNESVAEPSVAYNEPTATSEATYNEVMSTPTTVYSEPVSATATSYVTPTVVAGSETFDSNQKKAKKAKKSSLKWGILLGVVAVLAVVGVAVWMNYQVISNTVNKMMMSPEKYYASIEKKEIQEMTSQFVDMYDKSLVSGIDLSGKSIDYSVDLELGTVVYEMLGSVLAVEDAEGLSKIGLDLLFSTKNDAFSGEIAARLGDDRLISLNALVDFEKAMAYAQVPELSDRYIGADISAYTETITETMDMYAESMSNIPEATVVESLLNRYLGIVIDSFTNVAEEDKVLTVGDYEQKCTALTISISQKEACALMETICNTAKTDDELLDMLTNFVATAEVMDAQTAKSELVQAMEEYLVEVQTYKEEASDETVLSMCVWVNNKGEIVGREFIAGENEFVLSYKMPQSSNDYGYELQMGNDITIVEIDGAGTKSSSKLDGDFVLTVKDSSNTKKILTASIESLDTEKLAEGMLDVKCTIKPDKDLYELMGLGTAGALFANYQVIYEAKTEPYEEVVTVSLMNGEELLGRLITVAKMEEAKEITAPTDCIVVEGDEQLIEWMATIDFSKFMDNISKSDMPEELVTLIQEYVEELEMLLSYY